ncbi:MAG: SUMF1/EgtB/PvdO family nonheme iron enzyme [Desulfobacteraceae bacterium]
MNKKNLKLIIIFLLFVVMGCAGNSAKPGLNGYSDNEQDIQSSDQPARETITDSLGMEFVYINPGTFTMGSPQDEPGRDGDETEHKVTLSKGFFIQKTEVSQGVWESVMGDNPSIFQNCGDDCPVENVSWNKIMTFIERMNQIDPSLRYRLPTEAEWEYAARAGTKTAFANGVINTLGCGSDSNLDKIGWHFGNSGETVHPSAMKDPNAWGLYDMHGNVWEWCKDYLADYPTSPVVDPVGNSKELAPLRVIRGGSWYDCPKSCLAANRHGMGAEIATNYIGFRLVVERVEVAEAAEESAPSESPPSVPSPPLRFKVLFEFDTAKLTDESMALLPKIIDAIKSRQPKSISISGHTDRAGTNDYNLDLSRSRADVIAKILASYGIDPSIIETAAFGEEKVIVKTEDGVREQKNRRAEIILE